MQRRNSARNAALGLLWGVLLTGCGSEAAEPVGSSAERVIYGEDDRQEVYELSPPDWQTTLTGAMAALMWAHRIAYVNEGSVLLRANSLGDSRKLCDGERFTKQPAAAFCTATLIDDDLVLTAGHCFGSDPAEEELCQRVLVVFDYYMMSDGSLALGSDKSVYACRKVVLHRKIVTDDNLIDFAIIQLDRAATPQRKPVEVSIDRPLAGDWILEASFGAGLPLKVEPNASIVRIPEEANFFVAGTDSFGGGSGGGLFDDGLKLVGHQVRGLPDWTLDHDCFRPAKGAEPREEHQLIATPIAALCDSGWPSKRLCHVPSACGDGVCSGTENGTNCGSDCKQPTCGDGLCEFSEHFGCPLDCDAFSRVPAEWDGDPADYQGPDAESTSRDSKTLRNSHQGCGIGRRGVRRDTGAALAWIALGCLIAWRKGAPPAI